MSNLTLLFIVTSLAGLALSLTPVRSAQAATRTVCASGCPYTTIAAAIAAASPGDTISVLDVTHTEAGIIVSKNLTIQGQGAASTTVDGGGSGPVFTVANGVTATIQDMTISNGSSNLGIFGGGGIANLGTLTVSNSILSGNSGVQGGGIANSGTLTVSNSTVSGNSATFGGGGIRNSGTLTVSNCTLSGNSATDGGGVANGGTLTVSNSTLSGNSVVSADFSIHGSGGGISNGGNMTISNSTISSNSTPGSGGGIYNNVNGTVMVSNSTISGNATTRNDGGGGGGIYNIFNGTVTVSNSTISGNSTLGFDGGGGILNWGTVTVRNSTLSGNSTHGAWGGGGIFNYGTATVSNSTLSGNSGHSTLGGGGGIANMVGDLRLKSTIVANSPSGGDCSGVVTATGTNLDTDGSCALLNPSYFTQVTSVALNLAPLAVNGPGTTATHALLTGSVAIDAASDCLDYSGAPVTIDQRGVVRPVDGDDNSTAICDIGAYELVPTVATLAAAVLPSGRSVQVGTAATAFATILNGGPETALGCRPAPVTLIPATFAYQTTDSATNALTGTANTPVDIPPGGGQSFVFAFTPTSFFGTTDVQLIFTCTNTAPAPSISGLNTLLLSASTSPVPDIVALAATLTSDGIVNIPWATGTGVFVVATVNLGINGGIYASVDTGGVTLPLTLSLCQTNPTTGQCISVVGPAIGMQINAGETPTFGIFVTGTGTVPFDPANNRIFVRFQDGLFFTSGVTSVAVRTH